MKGITTSWDDGHVLDFKLADLLVKYNLPATFYIPQSNTERAVMKENQIKELATNFEIGGHTLHHTRLTSANAKLLQKEIGGSYQWLSQLLGEAPSSFCFPGGVYNRPALKKVFESGYQLARTTGLFCTSSFSPGRVSATTLQAYPHPAATYAKHLSKRRRWATLFSWVKRGSESDLCKLTEYYLQQTAQYGGCFHLWGHSWEIEQHNLWKTVENIFTLIANRTEFLYLENRELVGPSSASVV